MESAQEPLKHNQQHYQKKLILEGQNCFSHIFFTYLSPLVAKGSKITLQQQNIPQLTQEQKIQQISIKFIQAIQHYKKTTKSEGMVFLKSAIRVFKKQFILGIIIGFIYVFMSMGKPLLTSYTINYVGQQQKEIWIGITMLISFFILSQIMNVLGNNLYQIELVTGIKLNAAVNSLIIKKAMKFPSVCSKKYSMGDLLNYNQVDAQRMNYCYFYFSIMVLCPIQIILGLILLYIIIGPSLFVGLGVLVFFLIVNLGIGFIQQYLSDKIMKAKDDRMKLTNQIVDSIRLIKSNAWEQVFYKRLQQKRKRELSLIRLVNFVYTFMIFSWYVVPPSLLSSIFTVFSIHNLITPEIAFTTIVLFNILQFPISVLPEAISDTINTWVSIKRIEKFLIDQEIQKEVIQSQDIRLQGTFFWEGSLQKQEKTQTKQQSNNKNDNQKINLSQIQEPLLNNQSQDNKKIEDKQKKNIVLKNISLQVMKGQFIVIVGPVGSGKSSLMYSLLCQTKKQYSVHSVQIPSRISYVPQKQWILNTSIKNNILLGKQYDKQRFQKSIEGACLEDDLEDFYNGIQTQIGQKGINLSGGQKARIGLARAIYDGGDLYLMDDIISAVDVKVGNRIIKNTLLSILRQKTIILITHSDYVTQYADKVLYLHQGQLFQRPSEQLKLMVMKNLSSEMEKKNQVQEKKQKQTQQIEEDRELGEVQWKVYWQFIKNNGGLLYLFVLFIFFGGWVVASASSSLYIKKWTQYPQDKYNLNMFVILALSSTLFIAVRVMFLILCSIKQGKYIHDQMTKKLIFGSLTQFYERVPSGRIVNRLSRDLKQIDQKLAFGLGSCLNGFFNILQIGFFCVYGSTPYILIPILFLFVFCYFFKNYYMKTRRQIVRLQAISKSPILSNFTQIINGLSVIRAYKKEEYFLKKHDNIINQFLKNGITGTALQRWFSIRLGYMLLLVNMSALIYCLFFNHGNAALAGLLIAYSFSLDDQIEWTIYSFVQLQKSMVSIERCLKFKDIPIQEGNKSYFQKYFDKNLNYERKQFISQGKIEFKNYTAKYREELQPVLKKLNFTIQPKQKIGVVGRTGAGKSSLTLSLLRMLQAYEGQILIDNQNIADLNLKDIRSSITYLPQQPILFNGTIRQNIDPLKIYTDQQVLEAIKSCCLMELINQRNGLESEITEGGQNLSIGQKQLICMCRAMLKKTKIIIIDQATANIDNQTQVNTPYQKILQKQIKKEFIDCTAIIIAHRINTIQSCDKILMMDKGKIVQYDTPLKLIQAKGQFASLYNEHRKQQQN